MLLCRVTECGNFFLSLIPGFPCFRNAVRCPGNGRKRPFYATSMYFSYFPCINCRGYPAEYAFCASVGAMFVFFVQSILLLCNSLFSLCFIMFASVFYCYCRLSHILLYYVHALMFRVFCNISSNVTGNCFYQYLVFAYFARRRGTDGPGKHFSFGR